MTVGIVIVSHSAKLAEAAAELAAEVAAGQLRVALAGGLDDPDHPLGTDAVRVLSAINEVDDADGVLVLMDLGSAVLSAELARDMLPPERQERVLLCEAPLVEGLVAAAVQAAAGADLERVAAEARSGLAAKLAHLGAPPPADARSADTTASDQDGVLTQMLVVDIPLGLHARPAARVIEIAARHAASLTVENPDAGRGPVPATSLNGLITLGARRGHRLLVRAAGAEAKQALAALRALAAQRFGDPPEAPSSDRSPAPAAASRVLAPGLLQGLAAAGGLAVGEVRRLTGPALNDPEARIADDADAERLRLDKALAQAGDAIDAARSSLAARAGDDAAEMLQAHRLLLSDPALLEPAFEAIAADALDAPSAWRAAVSDAVAAYRGLSDDYLAARAADVEAVGAEVLSQLLGTDASGPAVRGVAVGRDLSPAAAARLDPDQVVAIITSEGSPTSHSALVARALGIPAVVAAGPEVLALADGTLVAVDGDAGRVMIDPAPETVEALREEIRAREAARSAARLAAEAPAITADGTHVGVLANVGVGGDARRALVEGADGVGLLRTEFLFLDRVQAPDEDEQAAAYAEVCGALSGRVVTLRTLDAGGDKPLAYLDQAHEANPFLGVRGVRLGLARPSLLITQLRAALRVAAEHPLRLMFPMVSTIGEIRELRRLVDQARRSLEGEGMAVADRVELGVMVEVPSIALAEGALREVDFISIGTNDLTQYVMAAERGNAAVAHLADPLEPAVLRLIGLACEAAAGAGAGVGVCGGMAADLAAVEVLVGLGVRELSVPPPSIPDVKQRVRAIDLGRAQRLAERALGSSSAQEVRDLLAAAQRERA